jgi:deoxyribodipyrimidine photo-lyase
MAVAVWFRSDLRVDDNTALHLAGLRSEPIRGVVFITPKQWQEHCWATIKIDFYQRNVRCLQQTLAGLGIALDILLIDDFAAIPSRLIAWCEEHDINTVLANREYALNEVRRDNAVQQALAAKMIEWQSYDDATVLPPGAVTTQNGEPYKVFTPYKRRWLSLLSGQELCLFTPPRQTVAGQQKSLTEITFAADKKAEYWPAGEAAAQQRLQQFIADDLSQYHEQRDLPALDATSRLSPYLAFGVLSIRRCLNAVLAFNHGEWFSGQLGALTWLNELIWREFYQHIFAENPQLSRYKAYRPDTEQVPWRYDPEDFQHWCQGRTGFPLIDAAMRQLNQTGWMHNRLRMVAAMFLCKYLLIDWRWGERYFMQRLIDGEIAANNGGWQWCASTGTDAAPYFRLLSPVRQAERFDPQAEFQKHWLPELAQLPAKIILQPGHPQLLASGYPEPMVDTRAARERVLAAFAAAKHQDANVPYYSGNTLINGAPDAANHAFDFS